MIGVGCSAFFYFVFKDRLIPPQVRLFDFWIPLVVLVFMLILIRGGKPNQPFHFWEGFISGNMMCWLGGFFSGVFVWQISIYQPDAFHNFLSSSIKYLQESEKSVPVNLKMKHLPEVIDEIRNTQPSFLILDEFMKKVFYSFILVPLLSMIFRRK